MRNPNPQLKLGVIYAGTSPDLCQFENTPTALTPAVDLLANGVATPST